MFIVLEGIDGAGKSTQIAALQTFLQSTGHSVVTCADPGTTQAGLEIRRLLLGNHSIPIAPRTELMLFLAARAQLVAEVIEPARSRGQVVICDRFLLSSVVYQGHLGKIPPAEIWELGALVVGQSVPDLTVVLDLPATVAATRSSLAPDRIESRGADYLEAVRQGFLSEARQQPGKIRVLDATQPSDSISRQLIDLVRERFPQGPTATGSTSPSD